MHYLSTNYLIIYAFLLITLVIGLRAGRGIKDIREYAIANKAFGTGALVLTLLATNIAGASVINVAASVFSIGIIMTIALLGSSITFLLTGLFIAPKAANFDNCLTMGDLMKGFYGSYSGIITGLLGCINAILLVGMELHVLGIMCETLLGIQAKWGIIVGGLGLALYAAHGGIKAVTMTDIFQFAMLAVFIPLIAYMAVGRVGGIQELLQKVPATKLEVFTHKDFSFYATLFLMWTLPAGLVDAAIVQRMLMAKRGAQLRNQYLVVAAFEPAFQLVIMLIGLSAIVLYPSIEAKQVVPHLIHQLLPVGIQGLAIAGVLAVGMSSIDSYLHAAGLTLSHDVIKPICDKKSMPINELKWAKYMTVLISLLSIYIGLKATDILGLAFIALEFVSPLLMFPLFSGMMGLKTDKKSFYTASVITLVAFVVSNLALPPSKSHFTILISMAANGLSFFGMHVIQNKGFAIIQRAEGKEILWRPRQRDFISMFKALLPTPKRIIAYSQGKVATYGAPYILFGVFSLINYTLPYFLWMKTPPQYETLMLYLRLIGATLCVLLIVQDKWSDWLLPYMPTFWHFTVLYCLPFMSTMMLLLTEASTEWLINIISIIILLLVLLDWMTAIIVSIVGIGLALVCYKLFIGPFSISLTFTAKYLMVYQAIFGILIGLIFARRKQQHFDKLATDHQTLNLDNKEVKEALLETFKEKVRLLTTLQRAGIKDLSRVVGLVKALRKQGQETFKASQPLNNIVQELQDTITPMAITLERIENRATDYLRLTIKTIPIDKLLAEVQSHFPDQNLQFKVHTQLKEIVCDPAQIKKMLVNSIQALKTNAPDNRSITIGLQDTQLNYPLHSLKENYVKKIPAIALTITTQPTLPAIEKTYQAQMNGSSLAMPAITQELLLVTNQRIAKAHYGYTYVDTTKHNNYTYLYVIPAQLTEVRPKDMNDPYMELGTELVRADDTYPGALAQEQEFLSAVEQQSAGNLEAIKTALEMIKWYHGPKNRNSGEPFYLHPLAVAQIVLSYNQDEATILGALLHDTVEDTPMLLENIEMMFGPEVVGIVDRVTHFESTQESFYKIKLAAHENILMLLEVEDKRALYVKIADRMHNMRTIEGHSSAAKRKQIAEETLQFFVPLAKELGLDQAAAELKTRSLAILNAVDNSL